MSTWGLCEAGGLGWAALEVGLVPSPHPIIPSGQTVPLLPRQRPALPSVAGGALPSKPGPSCARRVPGAGRGSALGGEDTCPPTGT